MSPCGTSILTNNAPEEISSLIKKYANAKKIEDKQVIEYVENIKQDFTRLLPEEAAGRSAEINGLYKFYKGKLEKGKNDEHILLATDTLLGKETTAIIGSWLQNNGIKRMMIWNDITGLSTDNLYDFHIAVTDLIKRLHETLPGYRENKYRIVFNLTGGFKSIQGVLHTISQFYADESIYVFEKSDELLRFPRLPIKLDVKDEVRNNLRTWRRLALNLAITPSECSRISDAFLFFYEKEVTLSPWGELVWNQIKKDIYEERFWEPPSDRITFYQGFDKFEKEVRDLEKDRLYELNKRMDELARYLEDDNHPNPDSLSCKKLVGNPVEGCTHEIYAWSDKDARRIYGVYDNNNKRFEIRFLGKKLR